jgi:hypothetical protein
MDARSVKSASARIMLKSRQSKRGMQRKENRLYTKLLLYASAQFVILTLLAMGAFPGGAQYDPGARRYLFLQNFFSDLGGTLNKRGQSNLFSMVLFVVALLSVGISLIIAAPAWRRAIVRGQKTKLLGHAAQLFAGLSGICYAGIAVTPWNLALDTHMFFVQGAFTLLLAFVTCLTAMQVQNGWPVRYISSNVVYLLVLTAYVFVLFRGPNLMTLRGLMFQVIAQKIIVYVSILNLAYQCFGVLATENAQLQPGMSQAQNHNFERNS